ncbi:four helix bundle protein [Nitrosophilus labii]|uniref:four helix bundle protein n=1 Tax=Nitrosophilus labii TaxID=2706014 RepID=UPI001656A18A|nr:four helix bundle protein [Nitrosophilus labii]
MNDYKDLKVWQNSISLVEKIYQLIKSFPNSEIYVLSDQIRRSAISIPSNIAEGASRNTKKEFIQFLYIALGSASELETQIIIAKKIGYINNIENYILEITKLRKMLNSLISSLKGKTK